MATSFSLIRRLYISSLFCSRALDEFIGIVAAVLMNAVRA